MTLETALDRMRRATRPSLVVHPDPASSGPVALLPGSFDPVTRGHLALARRALDHADLVVLLYSVRTLPKEQDASPPLLSEDVRLAALEAVSRSNPRLRVGVASHGLLADQVRAAGERFPQVELFVAVGSDKVLQMLDPKWYRDRDRTLEELLRRARVLYAERAGEEGLVEAALSRPASARWRDRFARLEVSPEAAAISSRLVRDRLRRGADPAALVPSEAVPFLPASG